MIIDKTFSHIDTRTRKIVCEENKRKYIANNVNSDLVYRFKIDGEVINNTTQKRCDYLVENETSKNAFFVELKGVDIGTACMQILETICLYTDQLREYTIHSRIVCSRVPTPCVNDSKYRRLKSKCKDTKIKERHFEEDI